MPSLYVVLIGAQHSPKTTSIAVAQASCDPSRARRCCHRSFRQRIPREARELPGSTVYPEFSRALAAFRRDYMAGIVDG